MIRSSVICLRSHQCERSYNQVSGRYRLLKVVGLLVGAGHPALRIREHNAFVIELISDVPWFADGKPY
jgi:hypothetical protein